MGHLGFFPLQLQAFQHYYNGNFEQAMEAIVQAEREYPDMLYKTVYWKACLYCALGEPRQALAELKSGLKAGVWWNPDRLRRDSDLQLLQHLEEFQEILEKCQEKLSSQKSASKPELLVWQPDPSDEKRYPLILSLHWRGDNAKLYSGFWHSKDLMQKYVFAFPQSSQIYSYNEFCWDDEAIAKKEILESYKKVIERYPIDHDRVIIAGASQGGRLALELCLKENDLRVRGFILVVPSLREPESYIPMIESASGKNLRGVIITGDKDYGYEKTCRLFEIFEKYQFPCRMIVHEGLAHSFPSDFTSMLPAAVDYVLHENEGCEKLFRK